MTTSRKTGRYRLKWLVYLLLALVAAGVLGTVLWHQFADTYRMQLQQRAGREMLRSLHLHQTSFFKASGTYEQDLKVIGYDAPRGNRYAVFAAPTGPVQHRDAPVVEPMDSYRVIAVDTNAHPSARTFDSFADTGCPLTTKLADGREGALGVRDGVFIGAAVADLDGDETLDCWSVSTADRLNAAGLPIRAGVPFNEQSDLSL